MHPFNVDLGKDTICDVIRRWAEFQPHAPALVSEKRAPLTYGALATLMDDIRGVLNASGLGRGDRIGIIHSGGADMMAVLLGVMNGATAVPLNPSLSKTEITSHMGNSGITAMVVEKGIDSPILSVARQLNIPCLESTGGHATSTGDVILEGLTGVEPRAAEESVFEDVSMVLSTSGTTSVGKIVPMGWRETMARYQNNMERFDLCPEDCRMVLRPLYYTSGSTSCMGALYSGGNCLIVPSFNVEGFYRVLVPHRITWVSCGPTFLHAIYDGWDDHKDLAKGHCLRFIRSGTSRLDPEFADKLEQALGVPILESYGSTESGRLTWNPLPPGRRKRGTVGMPQGNEVAIVGPDGSFLEPGAFGEIVTRGNQVIDGYENDDEANAAAFVDGWYHTGDEGFFDEDGYLTLVGRIKEVINRGGEKVIPAEVDAALMSHPDVVEAATFPISHQTLGEEVAAAVVRAPGTSLDDKDLTKYLLQRLVGFKVPRQFAFVEAIPKGETGKLQRYKLATDLGLDDGASVTPGGDFDRAPNALEARLQNIWARALNLDRVGLDENFFLLGGDSLQAVELFFDIQKELGHRLPRAALFEAGTVAEMARLIEDDRPSSCMVPMQTKGRGTPFFCIHDGNGDVLNFRELARHMGKVRPFYGIQCVGLDGKEMPFIRMEDMAAHYIAEIRKVQASGPYYIGGYSFGGRVAYVIAQKLWESGEIGLLALLDTSAHSGQSEFSWKNWAYRHLARLKTTPKSELCAYFAMRVGNVATEIRRTALSRAYGRAISYYRSRGKTIPRYLYQPIEANDLIRSTTKLKSFEGDAVLFRTTAEVGKSDESRNSGWRSLIQGNLKVIPSMVNIIKSSRSPTWRTWLENLRAPSERSRD